MNSGLSGALCNSSIAAKHVLKLNLFSDALHIMTYLWTLVFSWLVSNAYLMLTKCISNVYWFYGRYVASAWSTEGFDNVHWGVFNWYPNSGLSIAASAQSCSSYFLSTSLGVLTTLTNCDSQISLILTHDCNMVVLSCIRGVSIWYDVWPLAPHWIGRLYISMCVWKRTWDNMIVSLDCKAAVAECTCKAYFDKLLLLWWTFYSYSTCKRFCLFHKTLKLHALPLPFFLY